MVNVRVSFMIRLELGLWWVLWFGFGLGLNLDPSLQQPLMALFPSLLFDAVDWVQWLNYLWIFRPVKLCSNESLHARWLVFKFQQAVWCFLMSLTRCHHHNHHLLHCNDSFLWSWVIQYSSLFFLRLLQISGTGLYHTTLCQLSICCHSLCVCPSVTSREFY